MLNEWSDRSAEPTKPKPIFARGEFWLGILSTAIGLGLLVGFLL